MADDNGDPRDISAPSTGVPREPPVIEGVAEPSSTTQTPPPHDVEPNSAAERPERLPSRIWPSAVAVLVGACVAVGGAYGLHSLDTAGSTADPRLDDITARLDAVSKQADATASVTSRLDALDSKTAALPAAIQGTVASYDSRLKVAEAAAQDAAASAAAAAKDAKTALDKTQSGGASASVDLAPIEAHLADLDKRLAAAPAEAGAPAAAAEVPPVDLTPLQTHLAELDKEVEALKQAPPPPPAIDLGPLQTRLGDIEKHVAAIDQRLTQIETHPAPPPPDVAPLEAGVADLTKRLAPLEAQLAVPKVDRRAPEDRESGAARAEANAPAITAVVTSLMQKMARGAPFPVELAALDNLGVDKAKLDGLRPLAEKGLPTLDKLADTFDPLIAPLQDVEAGPPTTYWDRIAQGASRLVRVRRTDEAGGADVSDHVLRIKAELAQGHLDTALTAWQDLPDAAKAKSQAWADAAKARLKAEDTARAIEAEAVAALAKAKS